MSSTPPMSAGQAAIPPEVALILNAYAAAIKAPINLILIVVIFGSMLIPILITLLWFSTPATRRQPIFILNVASVVVGIAVSALGAYDGLFPILHPTTPTNAAASNIFTVVFLLAPWVAELVLAFRLAAVFPPRRTPLPRLLLVFAYPVAIKCVRFGFCVAVCVTWLRTKKSALNNAYTDSLNADWRHVRSLVAELFLRIFDNAYLSIVFIYKLHKGHIFRRGNDQRVSLPGQGSLTSKLRALFWIAVGNFVFPVIFDIACIIDLFVDHQYLIHMSNLLLANYYLSIIGVVFATVWSSSMAARNEERTLPTVQLPKLSGSNSSSTNPPSHGHRGASRTAAYRPDADKPWTDRDSDEVHSPRDVIPLSVMVKTEQLIR